MIFNHCHFNLWALGLALCAGMVTAGAQTNLSTVTRKALLHDLAKDVEEGSCGGVQTIALDQPPPIRPASGNFQIVASFNANVPSAERAVIQQAINEWSAVLQSRGVNPGSYTISFAYGTLGANVLGSTSVSTYNDGSLASAAVTIGTGVNWFIDPTPADDAEFTGGMPPAGFDLLAIMRHEIGHALGWTTTSRTTGLTVGGVFDASRLNIPIVTATGFHTDAASFPYELMTPSIGTSTRRTIKLYPSAAMLARAFQYQIPMHFVDPAVTGGQTGTAWQPWSSLPNAMVLAPSGLPLLLAPSTFSVSRNQTLATGAHTLYAARGGAVVIAP